MYYEVGQKIKIKLNGEEDGCAVMNLEEGLGFNFTAQCDQEGLGMVNWGCWA